MRVIKLISLVFLGVQCSYGLEKGPLSPPLELEQRDVADDPDAMVDLGRKYLNGTGVAKDPAKAMEWFLKGALKGDPPAQVGVGFLFSRGIGVPMDKIKAGEWFRRAAEQNDPKGQFNLAILLNQGSLGGGKVPESLEWFKKAADQGMMEAQAILGDMYFCSADGVAQDFPKAAHWLEKAAEGGDNPSRTTFGSMLRFGNGIPADKARAYRLFRTAATEGYGKAMCQLADMLAEGDGDVVRQPVIAAAWYIKAVRLGETAAQERWKVLEPTLTPEQASEAARLSLKLPEETP